jgi:hypothetical protein
VEECLIDKSNEVLFKVLKERYGFVSNKEFLTKVFCNCEYDLCIQVLKSTSDYKQDDMVGLIIYLCKSGLTKEHVKNLFDIIANPDKKIKINIYELYNLSSIENVEVLDYLIERLNLSSDSESIATIIGNFHNFSSGFEHISRKYIKNQSSAFKTLIAEKLNYNVEKMLKGKGFDCLIFLLNEIGVPLEFNIMEEIGKKFKSSRISFTDPVKEMQEHNITSNKICELLDICHQKSRENLKRKFENN